MSRTSRTRAGTSRRLGGQVGAPPRFAGVGIILNVRAPDHPVEVQGSRGQLARVLGNLVDNAQRHTTSTVTVELRADGTDAVLTVTVTDDGHGIAHSPKRATSPTVTASRKLVTSKYSEARHTATPPPRRT
ncbi:sensor histidine kinase [Streptomyces sp. NPDC057963]|uniref:sensor histidine kinase n=1 Tax=Streptomyces sp. NPDC057963 TaxID=3346290 RepID=UPI0036EA60A7